MGTQPHACSGGNHGAGQSRASHAAPAGVLLAWGSWPHMLQSCSVLL
jgi:hypothetical protein